jgi:hypothetical protein
MEVRRLGAALGTLHRDMDNQQEELAERQRCAGRRPAV